MMFDVCCNRARPRQSQSPVAQTNVGLTIGGSNATVNFIPSFALRGRDFVLFDRRIAIGVEFRSPISLFPVHFRTRGAFGVD